MPPKSSDHAVDLSPDGEKMKNSENGSFVKHTHSHMNGDCESKCENSAAVVNQQQPPFNRNTSNVCGGASVPNSMNCNAGVIGTASYLTIL